MLSSVAGGMLPGEQALEVHQHTLFRHLKIRFLAEIGAKICLKMRIFWKKAVKSPKSQGIRPQTPLISSGYASDPRPLCCYAHLLI